MPRNFKLGSLNPVIYFQNADGIIQLPPTSDVATPRGFHRCEAGSLPEIDRLQKQLEQQERETWQRGAERDEAQFSARREAIRSSLTTRMCSADCSAYEREFIQLYLRVREENKRELYQKKFGLDVAYFIAREMDSSNQKQNE